jgi:hypothetical protein
LDFSLIDNDQSKLACALDRGDKTADASSRDVVQGVESDLGVFETHPRPLRIELAFSLDLAS